MAEYLSPGVYVEEFDSGVKAMEGVSTSTAGFVGRCVRGVTMGIPTLLTSFSDFTKRFGSYLSSDVQERYLAYAVEQFFANGGSSCYVVRVVNSADEKAVYTCKNGDKTLTFSASSVGDWANHIIVDAQIVEGFKSKLKKSVKAGADEIEVINAKGFQVNDYIEIKSDEQSERCLISAIDGNKIKIENADNKLVNDHDLGDDKNPKVVMVSTIDYQITFTHDSNSESFMVSCNRDHDDFFTTKLAGASLITLNNQWDFTVFSSYTQLDELLSKPEEIIFTGGKSGNVSGADYIGVDNGPGKRTGIKALLELSNVSIVAAPGICDPVVQQELVNQCENKKDRFAILDMPKDFVEINDLLDHRSYIDSSFAAMYHPWLLQYDMVRKTNTLFPPSGAIAGVYAKVDNERGVFKAPANVTIANTLGLGSAYNEAEQAKLNPKGINLIRNIPGSGLRIWGARTCSSDGNWKYINVRRLFIYIEQSIYANTNWAVFEPNDETLWTRVSGTIQMFLNTQWRNGALMGTTPDEAYYVNIGKGITMSDDDILNGRMICEIGIAPVRPAEFVIFRITQNTASGE